MRIALPVFIVPLSLLVALNQAYNGDIGVGSGTVAVKLVYKL